MTAHEVVIRLGHPFDIKVNGQPWAVDVREVTIPFDNQAAAEAAAREITVSVREVHDAGGEDYRPVVAGEVVRVRGEITG